jgi:hypothetical protein
MQFSWNAACAQLSTKGAFEALIVELLRRHFADADHLQVAALRNFIWNSDFKQSEILIESVFNWKPDTTKQRPALLVRANDFTNRRLGIGDRLQGVQMDAHGNPHFSTMWDGSATVFVIAGNDIMADLLAGEVQRHTTEYASILLRVLRLHRFGAVKVGKTAFFEEARQKFVIPVTIGVRIEHRWILIRQAPRLKAVIVGNGCRR